MSIENLPYNEMSIVFPHRRRDFLAPSKALQELKEKLGPVYFDAKLIECPQNAVELGKLLQKWEELDKQKFKKLSDTSREQRILQNSLSSRHVSDPSTVSLLSKASSTRSFVEITNRNTPPPGFRFHANGDPKTEVLETSIESAPDSKTSIFSRGSAQDSTTSTASDGKYVYNRDDDDDSDRDATTPVPSKSRDQGYEEIDYSKEIDDLEALILQLEGHLIRAERTATSGEEEQSKHNYLRAHANTDDIFESCLNRPSANYAYDPDQKHKRDRRHIKVLLGPSYSSAVKKSSKCLACQFKLKHVGNEFTSPKKTDVLKERWNIAPRGCFLSSPSNGATSALSLSGSTHDSKSLLSYGLSTPNFPVSRELSSASARRSADRTTSMTSSRVSSKDLDPRHFNQRSSSKNLGLGLSATSNFPVSRDTSKTFSRRSADRTISLTSSRASSKDLVPGSSSKDLVRGYQNKDLDRGVSSATCGSPVRRFISPLQRESRMQMLRSQAEQDSLDCQEKVNAFLGHLDKKNSRNRNKQPWEYD